MFVRLVLTSPRVNLPGLQDVRGAFNLQSSEDIDDACSHFQGMAGQGNTIKGTFTCKGSEAKPGGVGTPTTGPNDGGSGSTTSSSAANPMYISGATGVMGVIAAIFGLL